MDDKLYILWTSDNPNTAHHMVFMYAVNALLKGWWQEVTVIIWGSSAGLAGADDGVKEKIKLAKQQGVHVSACIACATQFGVVEELGAQGIEVIPWGEPLTKLIKSGAHLITI